MKVSIVIPVYNVEKYISACIDSVLSQTYQDIEIIVIDDCSPDKSISIIEAYQSNKIHIYAHKKNKGLSASRNTGVTYCTGDYILFLDSDDTLNPKALEHCLCIVQEHGSEVVSFNSRHIDEEGNTWPLLWHKKFNFVECFNISIVNYPKLVWDVAAWNKLISLKLYRESNLIFDEEQRWFEDHLFSLQLYNKARKVSITTEVLHYYLKRTDSSNQSITQQKTFLTCDYRIRMIESVLPYLESSDNQKLIPYFFDLILSFYRFLIKDAFDTAETQTQFFELVSRFKKILERVPLETMTYHRLSQVDVALIIKHMSAEDIDLFYRDQMVRPNILEKLFSYDFEEKEYFLPQYLKWKDEKQPNLKKLKSAPSFKKHTFYLFMVKQLFTFLINSRKWLSIAIERNNDIYLIQECGEFDLEYYTKQTNKIFDSEKTAIIDYAYFGEGVGLCPNPSFCPKSYLDCNTDLLVLDKNLFAHYLRHGRSEGRICSTKGICVMNNKVGYFPIPKVACTSIKNALYELEFKKGFSEEQEGMHIHDAFNNNQNLALCDFNFIVIRDPIKRFLSAYSNRVLFHGELSESTIQDIHPSLKGEIPYFDPTITQFIENLPIYLKVLPIQHHIQPISEIFDKARSLEQFDKIYPLESLSALEDDLSIMAGRNVRFKHSQTGGPRISLGNLNRKQMENLLEYYRKDYELLNEYYPVEQIWQEWESSNPDITDKNGCYIYSNKTSVKTAELVLKYLVENFTINSITHFGCRKTAWLIACSDLGILRCLGLYEHEDKLEGVKIETLELRPINLTENLHEHFDLVISLQLVENLNPAHSEQCIKSLCHSSNIILFGSTYLTEATKPNCQKHSYWATLFAVHGYVVFDLFRPMLHRHDEKGESWYKDNLFLYVKQDSTQYHTLIEQGFNPMENISFMDSPHPLSFTQINS